MGLLKWFVVALATCATLATCLTNAAREKLVELFLARIVNHRRGLPRRIPELAEPGEKVNDSLYELYKPEGTPSMQILFFHGLRFGVPLESHMWSTWQSGDGSCIWPQKWLVESEEFPNAQIFLVSYDGSVRNNLLYSPDMYIITENLTSDLLQGGIGQTPNCPVILVGHCCGGIVIKELCLRVNKMLSLSSFKTEKAKLKNFLYSTKGILYYSTPHHGISELDKQPIVEDNPLLTYFQTLSKKAKRLNQEFGQLREVHPKWRIHGLGTSIPTNMGPLGNIKIGFEESGRDGHSYNVIAVDHYAICKPQNKQSRSYYALTSLVKSITQDPEVVHLCHDLQDFCPGLENLVQAVEEKLRNKKVIAIVGMGGVGKTTIAKKLFNNISREYEYTCFVDNVKGIPSNNLNRQLLDEFYCNGIGVKSKQMDWSQLKGRKTLLVMDDVDSEDQLKCLPASLAAFGSGSHLIITSRDREVLKHPKFYADSDIYDVDLLGDDDAKKLFCYHAFGSDKIPSILVSNVERVVEKCQGLPLTLEVLGRYLRGKDSDLEIWKETFDKLGEAEAVRGGENDRVWAQLRISYDKKLSPEEQEMFIDAATFFFEQPLDRALVAWSTAYGNPRCGWENLLSTCMVKVKEVRHRKRDEFGHEIRFKEVWVHEHLRDLAKKLSKAEVSSMRDAVGNTDDAMIFWRRNRVWKNGLRRLRNKRNDEEQLQLDLLDKMENLKYLEVEISPAGLGKKFPRKLSLLSWSGSGEFVFWRDHQKLELLPINLEESSDLAILELSSLKVLEEFSEALGTLKKLRTLSLSSLQGIHRLPRNFGSLSALEYLECDSLGLSELPESFGRLSLLKHLILTEKSLKSLPNSFSKLLRLERLWISSESLKDLGDSFGNLGALKCLQISCPSLETLPPTFGLLFALEELRLNFRDRYSFRAVDNNLKTLPENFCQLTALKRLSMGATGLKALPDNIGDLSALKDVELDCPSLEKLPANFGRLHALKNLTMSSCEQLQTLPENFGELLALRSLEICHAKSLAKLPDNFGRLSALEELTLFGCEQLQTLPENFGELLALRSLRISYAKSLEKLPDNFRRLSALEELGLIHCEQLQRLPDDFGELKALKTLKIRGVAQLKVLPDGFGLLSALEKLEFGDCAQLQTLPDNFRQLTALKELTLSGEVHLEVLDHIETLGNVISLEVLWISLCSTLETLPESIGRISSLRTVRLWACERIKNLPDTLGKRRLPQQNTPLEGHSFQITATEGLQLEVSSCPLLDASVLERMGWAKFEAEGYLFSIYRRRSESDDEEATEPSEVEENSKSDA